MRIVIDSNVLFSALIKDSATRKIILEYDEFFLFPSYIFDEMEKHKEELLQKSRISIEDFEKLLQLILKRVLIVAPEVLKTHKEDAIEIIKDIDLNDALFIACALAYPESVIWSDDKKMKQQKRIRIINTFEMIGFLEKR